MQWFESDLEEASVLGNWGFKLGSISYRRIAP
jgi:hypothetical protein